MEPEQVNTEDRSPYAPYKSIVAYDGTHFHGFQRQRGDIRTVQGVLETALTELGWSETSLLAAGRTDTGVHARGQVICFNLAWAHDPAELTAALNAQLPEDVGVHHTALVGTDFHPRYSALQRTYSYHVVLGRTRDPLAERYAWRIPHQLDIELLNQAAGLFVGTYDFGAFGTAPKGDGATIRTVMASAWRPTSGGMEFKIVANAFLYRMVRKIVAATLEAGSRRNSIRTIQDHLEDPTSRWEGGIAPAKGLVLEHVDYPPE